MLLLFCTTELSDSFNIASAGQRFVVQNVILIKVLCGVDNVYEMKISTLLTMAGMLLASGSLYAQTGSDKSGIDGTGLSAISERPSGEYYPLLSRSSDVVGYDFQNGTTFIGKDENKIAQVVVAGNGDIYLRNPVSKWETNSWIKLTKENGDTLVAHFPQVLYTESGDNYYAFPLFYDAQKDTYAPKSLNDTQYVAESKFVYKDGVLRQVDDAMISLVMSDYTWMDSGDSHLVVSPVSESMNALPASLADKTKTYIISYDKGGDDPVSVVVKGVVDGDKVYLSSPKANGEEQWIIGTLKDGNAVFQTNQYLGPDTMKTKYHVFLHTASFTRKDTVDNEGNQYFEYNYTEIPSLTFTYQPDKNSFSTNGDVAWVIRDSQVKGYVLPGFYEFEDVAATPKDPSFAEFQPYNSEYKYGIFNFVIPTLDVNQKYLNPDELYYCFYVDDDTIPHVFYKNDYIYMPADSKSIFPVNYSDGYDMAPLDDNVHQMYYYISDFNRIGLQSIYKGGGEERRSNIVYVDNHGVSGIAKPHSTDSKSISSISYFDLTGRKLVRPEKGINLKRITYSDGTSTTEKFLLR